MGCEGRASGDCDRSYVSRQSLPTNNRRLPRHAAAGTATTSQRIGGPPTSSTKRFDYSRPLHLSRVFVNLLHRRRFGESLGKGLCTRRIELKSDVNRFGPGSGCSVGHPLRGDGSSPAKLGPAELQNNLNRHLICSTPRGRTEVAPRAWEHGAFACREPTERVEGRSVERFMRGRSHNCAIATFSSSWIPHPPC